MLRPGAALSALSDAYAAGWRMCGVGPSAACKRHCAAHYTHAHKQAGIRNPKECIALPSLPAARHSNVVRHENYVMKQEQRRRRLACVALGRSLGFSAGRCCCWEGESPARVAIISAKAPDCRVGALRDALGLLQGARKYLHRAARQRRQGRAIIISANMHCTGLAWVDSYRALQCQCVSEV